jgi:hypothetical protein
MAGKATSVYLTVSVKGTHATAFHKQFFNMSGWDLTSMWPQKNSSRNTQQLSFISPKKPTRFWLTFW